MFYALFMRERPPAQRPSGRRDRVNLTPVPGADSPSGIINSYRGLARGASRRLHSPALYESSPGTKGPGHATFPPLGAQRLGDTLQQNPHSSIPRGVYVFLYILGLIVLAILLFMVPRGGASPGRASRLPNQAAAEPGTCGAGASCRQDRSEDRTDGHPVGDHRIGMDRPVSQTAGPVVESPIRSCFEHSAQGAPVRIRVGTHPCQ